MTCLKGWLAGLRQRFETLPDARTGRNVQYAMADAAMAALSMFVMQCPSFLAYQRAMAERGGTSNARTLYGIERIPCDNQIRSLLDTVDPDRFAGGFHELVGDLGRRGALKPMQFLPDRLLIALDGTEFFCSRKVHCDRCSTRRRGDSTEYFHQMVAAVIVTPERNLALPLPPEFITPQDGHDKQDCEQQAVKRWLDRHGAHCASLRPVYLGDDLYSRQPVCKAILDSGGDFLFVAKPSSHRTLNDFLQGITPHRRTVTRGRNNPTERRLFNYRWVNDLPIRDGKDALHVNWLEVTITRRNGRKTYRNSWVTSLPVTEDNVEQLVDAARARWKIENESFNVLKNHGYHLEHNFGHGRQNLANVLVALNLIAFALHTACDLTELLWQKARDRIRNRQIMFQHLRIITAYQLFPSWRALLQTLARPP